MIFWYRNSVLASIVSIAGCAICIGGVSSAMYAALIPGIALVILGYVISQKKAEKKQQKAQPVQSAGQQPAGTASQPAAPAAPAPAQSAPAPEQPAPQAPAPAQSTPVSGPAASASAGVGFSMGEPTLCPHCMQAVKAGSAFCNHCGTPIPQAAPEQPDQPLFCPSCGKQVQPGSRFCSGCGHQF